MKIVTTSRSLYLPLESPKKKREPEDRKKKIVFEEIMAPNFTNSMKTINPQIQVDQWTPNTEWE